MTTVVGREERLTFKGNLRDTRYGWLRLTPAYSVHLVADLLDQWATPDTVVLDPYCGTGTTALVCAEKGIESATTDINPFLVWLAAAKAADYTAADLREFGAAASLVRTQIERRNDVAEWLPALHQIDKWWDTHTLHALGRGMAAIQAQAVGPAASDLLRVAFCRTLIERASVSFGHQSMSFKKRVEREALFPSEDLAALVSDTWATAVRALEKSAFTTVKTRPRVILSDARELSAAFSDQAFGCVITSPPYPNRMSYIRELRPYMYWLGFLEDGRAAGELDWQAIGGTWGCATSNVGKWEPTTKREVSFDGFQAILDSIAQRSDLLSRYVHKYFFDMTDHLTDLARCVAPGGIVHYIVGNSKFYDTMLPVEQIYAELFSVAGFADATVTVLRKRSSKRELFEFLVSARKP